MAIHIPIGSLKTRSGLEPVPRCKPSTYHPISRWHNHCAIGAGLMFWISLMVCMLLIPVFWNEVSVIFNVVMYYSGPERTASWPDVHWWQTNHAEGQVPTQWNRYRLLWWAQVFDLWLCKVRLGSQTKYLTWGYVSWNLGYRKNIWPPVMQGETWVIEKNIWPVAMQDETWVIEKIFDLRLCKVKLGS